MKWALSMLALVLFGTALRRLLRLDRHPPQRPSGLSPLGADREAIYEPLALEVETQAAILGISLNDAMNERDAGHSDTAWRLVRLSVSEWDRLAEMLSVLLNALSKHVASARAVVPPHAVAASRFKSRVMFDYVRMHEVLDQLVFRSKLRFQLHIRVLRRAADTLTAEFRRAYRHADRTPDRPPELWNQLDYYFHDFDMVVKEMLLAFRLLLASLPHSDLPALAADLKAAVRRGVRSTGVPADR